MMGESLSSSATPQTDFHDPAKGSTVTCPEGKTCTLTCDKDNACLTLKLHGHFSKVQCSGAMSCKQWREMTGRVDRWSCSGRYACASSELTGSIGTLECRNTYGACVDLKLKSVGDFQCDN